MDGWQDEIGKYGRSGAGPPIIVFVRICRFLNEGLAQISMAKSLAKDGSQFATRLQTFVRS